MFQPMIQQLLSHEVPEEIIHFLKKAATKIMIFKYDQLKVLTFFLKW